MKTDLARSRARKARRVERVAENAALHFISGDEKFPPIAPKSPQDAILDTLAPGVARKARQFLKRGKSKPRRKKSPSLSKLKKLLWHEISLLVRYGNRAIDDQPYRCVGCAYPSECAGHVVPANSGGATAFFLPNLVPMCFGCNGAEKNHRGEWVYRFKDILGDEVVDALYLFNRESKDQSSPYFWQVKKWWVLEQTERIKKLRQGP